MTENQLLKYNIKHEHIRFLCAKFNYPQWTNCFSLQS